ncbi:MAG: hypothetical protein AB1523_09765 [Bacillota bacterium]
MKSLAMMTKETAQNGQAKFKRGGFIEYRSKFFVAPDLKELHKKSVTVIPKEIKSSGFEIVKIYYGGEYMTDAFNDVGIPWNKKLYRMVEECTEKQQGLYL